MRPLLRTSVLVAALIVSAIATPPSNHIKQSDNEENPPTYEYKYAVEDQAGDGHGKTETREGESTSGRYYVNSKRSLTDVKYVADEWGYHPVVQYGSSDNQSSSIATFAIGEKAVLNLHNKNDIQRNSDTLLPGERIKLVQLLQSPQTSDENIEGSDVYILRSNETWEPEDSTINIIVPTISLESITNSAPTNSLNVNYINTASNKKHNEQLLPFGDKIYFGKDHQLPAPQSNIISALNNDLPLSEEEQLVINSAGNFGQRIKNKETFDTTLATSTSSPISIYTDKALLSSTIKNENYFSRNRHKINEKPYLPNILPGLGAYSSTAFPFLDNIVTANSVESESIQNQDNNSIDNLELKTYSTFNNRVTGSTHGTTRNPFVKNYSSKNLFSSFSKIANEAIDKKKEYSFSKPIVVTDVPKEASFQYSTTFECEDTSSSTPDPILSKKNTSADTTSSYILNSIQAGVALVNSGDAHLISNDIAPNETIFDSLKEKIENPLQSDIRKLKERNYVGSIALTGYKTTNDTDSTVEVQRSIEIDHKNPLQNYETSTFYSDIVYADQQQQSTLNKNQNPEISFTNNAESNSNQAHGSHTRSEGLTKIYEITDIYPRDISADKPIYVIPPATYIIDDSPIFKNILLQENIQYTGDQSDVDSKIKNNEQAIQYSTKNSASTKPFRTPNIGTSYDVEIQHEHQPIVSTKYKTNYESIPKKLHHTPYIHPVEHIIDQNFPYQVETSYAKKIPIHQPYPIPLHVGVSQRIPFDIEKVLERKIPISLHTPISHLYSLEKQIHIQPTVEKHAEKSVHIPINVDKKVPVHQHYPVELEKIGERKIPYPNDIKKYVEQKVPMQAPYGVQYGVSYQQIMKPQNNGLYPHQPNKLEPPYALPLSPKHSFVNNVHNITKNINNANVNNFNHSQSFQGYIYDKPKIYFNERKENVEKHHFPNNKVSGKIFTYNPYVPPYSLSNMLLHRRYTDKQRPNKSERDDYFGPVPPLQQVQRQFRFPLKTFASFPITGDRTQIIRKSRNYEPTRYQKGNFRQSKMEYGFKPPMVPSVQYDEETASKVER